MVLGPSDWTPRTPESDMSRDWIAGGWALPPWRRTWGAQGPNEPDWFDRPGPGPKPRSSTPPPQQALCRVEPRGIPTASQVKPRSNFMLVAFVPMIERPADGAAARVWWRPYERDPSRWLDLPWTNRFSPGRQVPDHEPLVRGAWSTPGVGLREEPTRDVFEEYLAPRRKRKSAGPGRWAVPTTYGGGCFKAEGPVAHMRTIAHNR